jgi:hypothetical protein
MFAAGTAAVALIAALANEGIRYAAVSSLHASGFGPLAPGIAGVATVVFAILGGFAAYHVFRRVRFPVLFYPILSAWVLVVSFLPIIGMALGAEEVAGVSPDALRALAVMHLTAYFLVVPGMIAVGARARR